MSDADSLTLKTRCAKCGGSVTLCLTYGVPPNPLGLKRGSVHIATKRTAARTCPAKSGRFSPDGVTATAQGPLKQASSNPPWRTRDARDPPSCHSSVFKSAQRIPGLGSRVTVQAAAGRPEVSEDNKKWHTGSCISLLVVQRRMTSLAAVHPGSDGLPKGRHRRLIACGVGTQEKWEAHTRFRTEAHKISRTWFNSAQMIHTTAEWFCACRPQWRSRRTVRARCKHRGSRSSKARSSRSTQRPRLSFSVTPTRVRSLFRSAQPLKRSEHWRVELPLRSVLLQRRQTRATALTGK